MGVLFGERGNSFISFFQQSAAGQHGATATEERGVQPRIKRNYIAFVSSDRKQLRVNKRRIRGGGKDEGKEEERFNLLESRRMELSQINKGEALIWKLVPLSIFISLLWERVCT